MDNNQETPHPLSQLSNKYAKSLNNGLKKVDLATALVTMGAFDEETADYIQRAMVKLLNQLSRTGQRVGISDGRKDIMTIQLKQYTNGGRVKATFNRQLNMNVKNTAEVTLKNPNDAT